VPELWVCCAGFSCAELRGEVDALARRGALDALECGEGWWGLVLLLEMDGLRGGA